MNAIVRLLLVPGLVCFVALGTVAAQSSVFIVRHAEKASDAKDPDLSEPGRARAEALAALLRDSNIQHVFASEFKRTQQTATPLARAAGVEVTIVPASDTAGLAKKVRALQGNVLIVGHSNTVLEIAKALGGEAAFRIGEDEFDNLLVLTLGGQPRMLRLHYR